MILTPVAIAMVFKERRVLICQRKTGVPLAGFWEFPGGKIEAAETAEQCARREVKEETGIDIQTLEAWPTIEFDYHDRRVQLHPHLCRHLSGQARAIHCQQAIWVLPSELNNYRFPPANDALITRLQNCAPSP